MRLGFLVSSFGDSELTHAITREANGSCGTVPGLDVVVFYQNIDKPPKTPLFSLMNISEAFTFSGIVIATNLETARKARKFPGPKALYLYAWDLEWVIDPFKDKNYEEMADVYCDSNTPIIARSDSDANLIKFAWNRDVHAVVENCNLLRFIEVTKHDKG